MSGNSFGKIFTITTFGESHGGGLGVVVDGCPANIEISEEDIQNELDKRKPGVVLGENGRELSSKAVTNRKEPDKVEILSGVFDGKTTGTSIGLLIRNTNQNSGDYSDIKNLYRPGHGDYTYDAKYGFRDYRGGGRASGRETAARVAAGAIAKKILQKEGIKIIAWTKSACGIDCRNEDLSVINKNPVKACDLDAAEKIEARIEELRKEGNSGGGLIKCRITGLPAGLGEPVFCKADALLSQAVMSIGAVKGIEFGAGFKSAYMTGKEWNDPFYPEEEEDAIYTNKGKSGMAPSCKEKTNNAGGILAGITDGFPVEFTAAIKPVPSIYTTQSTVDNSGNSREITIKGRHDVCLCPRIIPVIEAMTAITIADLWLQNKILN